MTLGQQMRRAVEWMSRVVTQPRSELTRWEHAARFAYELARHGGQQLRKDNAPQMAGALAFRTLFGLLPVLVVGTLLVRAMQGGPQFEAMVAESLERIFDNPAVAGEETLPGWIMGMVARARTLDLTALGSVGVALLGYSAMSLMTTVEQTFNRIYRAPEGRSWMRRLPIYWTLLSLGPLAMGALVFVNTRVQDMVHAIDSWQSVAWAARGLWSLFVLWLLILTAFRLLPATRVAMRPAMVGALVSALLIGLGQQFLGVYLMNMQSIKLLGSVGLIPLFMFWVYVMWLAVLFGLEVATTLQWLRGRRELGVEPNKPRHRLVDPGAVVPLMEHVAAGFRSGEAVTPESLCVALGLAPATVNAMLDGLLNAGYLHRVGRGEALSLSRPPEAIPLDGLLAVGQSLAGTGETDGPSPLLQQLRAAQEHITAGLTLAGTPGEAPG